METTYIVEVLTIVFFAALVQSIVGFGYALLAAPLLTLIMGPKEMVVFLLFSGFYLNSIIFCQIMSEVSVKDIKYLFLGNLFGVIPGMYLLKTINVPMFKLFIGVVLLVSVFFIMSKFTWKSNNSKLEEAIFGFFSGFLGASSSVSGPPIILHMFNKLNDKVQIRARMVTFFTFGTLAIILILFFSGSFPASAAIGLPIYALPVVIIAAKLGKKIFYHINHDVFRKMAIGLILISSLTMLYGGYNGL